MNTLKLGNARILQKLIQGEQIPVSAVSKKFLNEMLDEGLIVPRYNKSRGTIFLKSCADISIFLKQRYGILNPLDVWIETMENDDADRSDYVRNTNDSKSKMRRTFYGFLLKVNEPVSVVISSHTQILQPISGTSYLIENTAQFQIPKDVLIIGIENPENFQHIEKYQHLFPSGPKIYVSRYGTKDFQKWIVNTSNKYLHFGDYDKAGIRIYQSEIFRYIGNRASFFIPDNIEDLILNGNTNLFYKQEADPGIKKMKIIDHRLQHLIDLINKYHRVFEQEGL